MIERLKKRRDFLAAAKGQKAARRAFVLESVEQGEVGPARLGFTVSKRTAKKAVERNRIRRRLREAVRIAAEQPPEGRDYVLVARRLALTEPFAALKAALTEALQRVAGRPSSTTEGGAQKAGR